MRLRFSTTCVTAKGSDIEAMANRAREITRTTFMRNVDTRDVADIADSMGYEDHPSKGLTMKQDWHIHYFSSRYRDRRCYYFIWSAIEHVFAD